MAQKYGLPPQQPDTGQIYVLVANGLKAVPVEFGISDERYTAIQAQELRDGEKVVVRATAKGNSNSGAERLRPMMPRM